MRRRSARPLRGLATLDYKRTVTELVKTTVYDAVVPFLPQAAGLGQPDRRASGQAGARHDRARHDARRGGGRAARALSRFARAHGADDSCSRNRDGDGQDASVRTIFRCTSVFRSVRRDAITARSYRQPRRSPVNSSSRIWTRSAARSRRQPRLSAQRASRCRASTSAAAHRPRWTSISWHGCCRRSKISFDFSHLREYTVEAGRPDTITPEKLRVLKSAGVGRVSINPQCMDDAVLAAIGRKHGWRQTCCARLTRRGRRALTRSTWIVIAGLTGDTAETLAQTVDTLIGSCAGEYHGAYARHQARRGSDR